ncbi:hypothetical protein BGZ73_007920 [Actinomortierella ambigua]|nr:hypothetical protein BGZ73_007920 [Actinomortierella ambigua]
MAGTAFAGNCGPNNEGYCMSGRTCQMEGGHIISGRCPYPGAGACCAWMILGIGVDVLHVPRLQRLVRLRPERFLTRILTKVEQNEFRQQLREMELMAGQTEAATGTTSLVKTTVPKAIESEASIRYLATRWALKEATYKALYPRHKLVWQDVTVYKKDGKPGLLIHGQEEFGIGSSHASVSHDGEYVFAQVVLESR